MMCYPKSVKKRVPTGVVEAYNNELKNGIFKYSKVPVRVGMYVREVYRSISNKIDALECTE